MDLTVVAYIAYLLIGVALTIWVARTLSRDGRVFLSDVPHGAGQPFARAAVLTAARWREALDSPERQDGRSGGGPCGAGHCEVSGPPD
ncbi:hypothetical protein ACFVU3_35215 [Streptomyces sp. NPDC058052]|uniref:hypothetical protein n=1 Tax=Streptomyces sp. NPDC058052 TaxID=3346316 RepID=UPI0036F01E86